MKPRPISAHDSREFPILYVDDEAANLRVFELTFRRDFSVLTAQSAEEGMRLLNDNPVAVVLSDQKMPGMTGVEFLSRVRELDDQAVRILVTAYGDAETLGAAINDGRIYRYVAKPWDPDQMALTLRRAIERYALDRERGALVDELTFLNWLSRTLHREIDPDRVVRLLIDAAHSELGLDAAAVLFFTPDRSALRWAAAVPRDEVAERLRAIELSRAGAPDFFERLEGGVAQAFRVDQMSGLEAPIRQWISEVSAEELVIVPLAGEAGVIGAIAIDNRSGGRRFGADDRTLLDGLSTQAVIALEKARTAVALRSSHEQLQRADRLGILGRLSLGVARALEEPLARLESVAGDAGSELEGVRKQLAGLLALGEIQPEAGSVGTIDILEIAREVASLVEGGATAASVEVAVEADPATPKVIGQRALLEQMLVGLTLNAIDATPAGERVLLRIAPDPDESGDGAWIEIVDAGPGMQPDELQQVFEPKLRLEEAVARPSLIVAQQIARQHGGTVSARSAVGQGSTVEVRLPAATDDPSA